MAKITVIDVTVEPRAHNIILAHFKYSDGRNSFVGIGQARVDTQEYVSVEAEVKSQIGLTFDEDDPEVKSALVLYDAANSALFDYERPKDLHPSALDFEETLLEERAEAAWKVLVFYCGSENVASHVYRRYAHA